MSPRTTLRNPLPAILSLLALLLSLSAVSSVLSAAPSKKGKAPNRMSIENEDAQELLEKAARLEEKGYPDETFRIYMKLMKKFENATIAQEEHLYRGINELLRKKISSWSEERLNSFRDFIGGDAQNLYNRALNEQNERLLLRVAERYFITEAGRKAAFRIANRSYKQGNFSTAAYWWNQLLKYHPDPGRSELDLNLRLLTAYRSAGQRKRFRSIRKRLKSDRFSLSGARKKQVKQLLTPMDQTSDDPGTILKDWPRPGGDHRGRGRVASDIEPYGHKPSGHNVQGSELLLLWTYPASGSSTDVDLAKQIRNDKSANINLDRNLFDEQYSYSPVEPMVYQNRLYLNDGNRVYAFELNSGNEQVVSSAKRLLNAFPDTGKLNAKPIYEKDLGLKSLAAMDGDLYFTLQNKLFRMGPDLSRRKFEPVSPPKRDDERLSFNGTPLVTDNGIYVPMVQDVKGETEIYLGCFSRSSGTMKWNRYLGVSFKQIFGGRRGDESPYKRKYAHLLAENSHVYLVSNMGLAASVNQVTGNINWIHDYSRYGVKYVEDDHNHELSWSPSPASTRGLQPPKIHDGVLYTLPWDAPVLLGFDLASGENVFSRKTPDARRFYEIGATSRSSKAPAKPHAFLYDHSSKNRFTKNFGLKAVPLYKTKNAPLFRGLMDVDYYTPSFTAGKKHLIFGGKKQLEKVNRSIFYMNHASAWPRNSKLSPHRFLSIGNRTILVGPGRLAVLTTARSLLDKLNLDEDSSVSWKQVKPVLRVLARNEKIMEIADLLATLIQSDQLRDADRERLLNLHRTTVLKAMRKGRDRQRWKKMISLGRDAMALHNQRTSTYLRIFSYLDLALFNRQKYDAMIKLYPDVLNKYDEASDRLQIALSADNGKHKIDANQYVKTRLIRIREKAPDTFKSAPKPLRNRFFSSSESGASENTPSETESPETSSSSGSSRNRKPGPFKKGRVPETTWAFNRVPPFAGETNPGAKSKGIPVVEGVGLAPGSRAVSISSPSEATILVYAPCRKNNARIPVKKALKPFSAERYRVRAGFTTGGHLTVLVEDRQKTTTRLLTYTREEKKGTYQHRETYTVPATHVRSVRFSRDLLFVHRREPNTSIEILDAYTRDDAFRKQWTRSLGPDRQLHWFRTGGRSRASLFLMLQDQNAPETESDKTPSPRNHPDTVSSFFEKDAEASMSLFNPIEFSVQGRTLLLKLDKNTGSLMNSLSLLSPRSLVSVTGGGHAALVPGKDGMDQIIGFEVPTPGIQWSSTLSDRQLDSYVLSEAEGTIYAFQLQDISKTGPENVTGPDAPDRLLFSTGRGLVFEKNEDGSYEKSAINLSSVVKNKEIAVVPAKNPKNLCVIQSKKKDSNSDSPRLWRVRPKKKNPYTNFTSKNLWKASLGAFSGQIGTLYGRIGPSNTLTMFHNFQNRPARWRGLVLNHETGRVLKQIPTSRLSLEGNGNDRSSFPLASGLTPEFAGGGCRTSYRLGPYVMELTESK